MIEAERNHLLTVCLGLVGDSIADNSFIVIFLDAIRMGYYTRNDDITLARNKLAINISEPKMDHKAVAVLDTS